MSFKAANKHKEGIKKKVVVCSANFPSIAEDTPLPQQGRDLIRKCETNGPFSYDAKAHHTLSENSDCKNRGEAVLEFLGTTNLVILNVGCKTTFRNSARKVVLDILIAFGRDGLRIRS